MRGENMKRFKDYIRENWLGCLLLTIVIVMLILTLVAPTPLQPHSPGPIISPEVLTNVNPR
jgi:hypothetical protein